MTEENRKSGVSVMWLGVTGRDHKEEREWRRVKEEEEGGKEEGKIMIWESCQFGWLFCFFLCLSFQEKEHGVGWIEMSRGSERSCERERV